MTRTTWNFHTAGQLVFGFDATDSVGALIRRRGWDRVLVVTDPILRKLGIVDRVTQSLAAAKLSVEIFDGGEPEPSFAAAENAIQAAGEFRPGVILGLGGGSNMDLAKIVAAVTTHGGTYSDYFNFDRVPGPVMPLVCLPTTSGTGSEVSHAAVLTDTANEMKVSTLSNYLRPAIAVVDPALTMSCPRKVTADSGIDALTHAIEAYTATDSFAMDLAPGELGAYEGRFPLADCIAEKAIALVGQHLVTAVNEPANREAREGMALASTLGGIAFSNAGVALVHALEYPLGGALHCSHGEGNGLLLPHVMRFNLPERKRTFAKIAELLGEDVSGLNEDDAAERAVVAVERLRDAIGIRPRIRDLGGREEQLPLFAEKAFTLKRLQQTNPRASTPADFLDILRAAF